MVEVAFTGTGGLEGPQEVARGGAGLLGEWVGGVGAGSEGTTTSGVAAVNPASQERLGLSSTMCSDASGRSGAVLSGPAGPGTPGLTTEAAGGDPVNSNAKPRKRYISAAAYLED